jgi:nitrogen fixation NifU-like protein
MANALYNAVFLDHAKNPDYKYQMDDPTFSHEGVNPSCGDELTFSVRMASDGTIEEAAFVGSGCAISQASADMMSDLMVDKTPQEAIELCELFKRMIRGEETDEDMLEEKLDEAAMLRDIAHMPARVKCAELAWRTLEEMLENNSTAGTATATVHVACDHDHDHDHLGEEA